MNITDTARSFFSRMRSSVHINPARDWLILFTLFMLAFASIVVWNVWAFDTVSRGGVIGTVATSTQPVFNNSSLNVIRTVFEKRAAEEAKYVTGVYRYSDPSQ